MDGYLTYLSQLLKQKKPLQEIVESCHRYCAEEIAKGTLPPESFQRPLLFPFMVVNPDPAALKAATDETQAIIDLWRINAVVTAVEIGNRTGLEILSPRYMTSEEDTRLPAAIGGFPLSITVVTPFDSGMRSRIRPPPAVPNP